MGKACRDMAEALRDCMVQQECMADGTKTLKQCLHDRSYSHECKVRPGYQLASGPLFIRPYVLATAGRSTAWPTSSASAASWICASVSAGPREACPNQRASRQQTEEQTANKRVHLPSEAESDESLRALRQHLAKLRLVTPEKLLVALEQKLLQGHPRGPLDLGLHLERCSLG
jgi:hypothetical protein